MNQFQPLAADDPRRLGAYDIVARLGEGGQGVVYLGKSDSGEQVAVKLLHNALVADADARTRFLREVAVAQRVARFCTAPVLHADLEGSRPYIVSEYVPGPSLRELVINEGPRRGAALERLAISTATALAAIHRAGILHRDFKPANVLMGPEGPVVIDFGIARALDSPGATATGMAMGTPSYLAPEQLSGAAVSEAADVFAWGVTMVFAATGKPAFGADSIPVVMNRILNEEPELGGMEGALAELVEACLSKDPARRPAADEIIVRLTGQPAPKSAIEPVAGSRPPSAAQPGTSPGATGGQYGAAGGQSGAGGGQSGAGGQDVYPGPWTQPTGPQPVGHLQTGNPRLTGPQPAAPPQTGPYGVPPAAAQHDPGQSAFGQGAPGQGGPAQGPAHHPGQGPGQGPGQSGPVVVGGPAGDSPYGVPLAGLPHDAPGMPGNPQPGMPHGSGPHSNGPHSNGPHSNGPHSNGPHSNGPHGIPQGGFPNGPHAAGPGMPLQGPGMSAGQPFQAGAPGGGPGGPGVSGPGAPGGPGGPHTPGGPNAPGGQGGPSGSGGAARQRRVLTFALSGAAAVALVVVAGAVVVQANSRQVPVTTVSNTAQDNASGDQPPAVAQTPSSAVPTDVAVPIPSLDIEDPKQTRKPRRTPTAQVPDPVTVPPRPTRTASPSPTRKKRTVIPPADEPTATPTSRPTTTTSSSGKRKNQTQPSPPPKPNSYKPTTVCGSGYQIIDSHTLGANAVIYLLYSAGTGKNCVVTMSNLVYPNKIQMNAILQVKGGSSGSDAGKFTAYAGPVRLAAAKKCVIWGGSWGALSWKSGWSHCS